MQWSYRLYSIERMAIGCFGSAQILFISLCIHPSGAASVVVTGTFSGVLPLADSIQRGCSHPSECLPGAAND